MLVTVRLFAVLRDVAGSEECTIALAPGAQALEAKAVLLERYPRLQGLLASTRVARNAEYQPWDVELADGDELCIIPPVSGG